MPVEPTTITPPPVQPQAFLNVPSTYGNGTVLNLSAVDVQIIAAVNGRPVSSITLPISVAKALQSALKRALDDYEKKTNSVIMESTTLSEMLKAK